ncbi:MAG: hypothetical protein K6E32_01255 [Lachnospiraceae bacterium]|nr:hypothetical protein [Lachnospiraceae bacterium]
MYPDRDKAEEILRVAESCNPGPWDTNLGLKAYFEGRMGKDLYEAVDKESFRP